MTAPVRIRFVVLEGELDEAMAAQIREAISAPEATVIHAMPTIAQIVDRVAYETGIRPPAMTGHSNWRGAVRARYAAIWIAYKWAGKTSGQICRVFDNRDHSSIHYAVTRAQDMRQRDAAFLALCDKVVAHFTGGDL